MVIFGVALALQPKDQFSSILRIELVGVGVGITAFIQGVLVIISYKDPDSPCKSWTNFTFSLLASFVSFIGFMSHVILIPR